MLNAITIDVEDYFHTEAMSGAAPRDAWDSFPSRVEGATDRLLELFARHEVKGTFFVLGWVAERFPALVQRIARGGHELACHSYWHRPVFRLTSDEFREDTRRAADAIASAAGCAVLGYRAPSFSITPGTEWAWDVLAELGFAYDSSVNPIRHDFYSNAAAPRLPYRVAGGRLLQIPIATVRAAGNNLPCGGGAYLRFFPAAYLSWGITRMNSQEQAPAMCYLHPWEVDPGQPRLKVGWKSRVRQYTNLSQTAQKLEHLLSRHKFTTVREAYAGSLNASPAAEARAAKGTQS